MGADTIAFYGEHQAGIATPAPSHAVLLALDLLPATDAEALVRLLRILTDDAARLMGGRAALADTEPELAQVPAHLTVTVGFGPDLLRRAGAAVPSWLRPLPAFGIDRLQDRWSGGDLLLQICADDPVTVAHAQRMLLKDSRAFVRLRWTQRGFRRAHGAVHPGTTMRNLFGQVDGTANPAIGSADLEQVVWIPEGPWAGGTSMVVRRIAMNLERWDELDRSGREQAIGRRLDTGAPLTGGGEHTQPDLEAQGPHGFPVIGDFAHLRRARTDDARQRILRRPYNYDEPADPHTGISDSGLVFVSLQADPVAQFVPIQQRLDELDLLNEWTTPIGSAVFAIPPGCAKGSFLGEAVLRA